MIPGLRPVLLLLALCLPPMVFAGDEALAEILGRLRQTGAAEFRYEEIRTLELASSPVKTEGYLLSGADGSLVKLQLLPRRIIMAISGGQMLYYDEEQKQRHSVPLDQSGLFRQQIELFRSLLQGRTEELSEDYVFAASRRNTRWKLKLTPKAGHEEDSALFIELSGDEKGGKQQLSIRQRDGESSRYSLEKTGGGKSLDYSIQRLLLEAAGE